MVAQVDLLVVNHNTKDKLQRLVEHLYSDYVPDLFNLYIADNGSTDGSVKYLEHLSVAPVEVFLNENIGYASAINQLAAESYSPYLAAINADVWMTSADVEKMVNFMNETPNVGALGPKQRDEQGRITHAGIFGHNIKPTMRAWMNLDQDDTQYRQREKCIMVSGSAFFMPRKVWMEMTDCEIYQEYNASAFGKRIAGAFLNTPHYYEETAYAYHVRAHGYDIWYDGTVSIGHTWHASSPKGGPADKMFRVSQKMFRNFCDMHDIDRD